jgi:hypothetical protein
MRYLATTIFFALFALAVTLIAISHFIESTVEMRTEYPTGQEWREHRQQADELEKKMQKCSDPVELEKLYRQHSALIEQWKKSTKMEIISKF